MNQHLPVYVPDIIEAVVNSMTVSGIVKVYFQAGRQVQILKELNDLDSAASYKDKKYPLIALQLPVKEEMRGTEFYAVCKIPRIVIATLSNGVDNISDRYKTGGTFKSILYPCYYEFLNRLAQSTSLINMDPDAFEHTKMDNPGVQPLGEGSTDYIDSIEILNLEFTLNQLKTC